jgi:3-hydroxy-3-methylglutaryl CoA synthase
LDEIRECERKAHEAFANRDFGMIKDYERDIKTLLKEVSKWQGFAKYYDKLAPSLKFISQVGNIYTGPSPLCMMSLLENGGLEAGSNILWFGYGSGNQAIAMIARTTEYTNKIAREWRTQDKLDDWVELTADEYSRLSDLKIHPIGYFGKQHSSVQ